MSWQLKIRARRGQLSLNVELSGQGNCVALVGPNGSGKTSVLQMITGAHRPCQGAISLAGQVLFNSSEGIDLPIEERQVGYVPQGYGLFPHLNVRDNIAFGLSTGRAKLPVSQRRSRVAQMLDELRCGHLIHHRPEHLSGGEKQQVALARALVVEPRLLLLDEPLAALDVGVRRSVRSWLTERIGARRHSTLLVTHDVKDVAALGASVCVLEAGQVVQRGSLAELRAAPATDFVAEFVDGLS